MWKLLISLSRIGKISLVELGIFEETDFSFFYVVLVDIETLIVSLLRYPYIPISFIITGICVTFLATSAKVSLDASHVRDGTKRDSDLALIPKIICLIRGSIVSGGRWQI